MGKQLDGIEIRNLRAGHQETVRQWFERYADPLYTFVFYRVGGDADTAHDIVQETFLTALKTIEDYEPARGTMFAWLSYLSRNCAKKALRDRNRSVPYNVGDSHLDARLLEAYLHVESQPFPLDVLERAETAELVRIALGSIPSDYATLLRQYYHENSPTEEISRSRGISTGAVRALLHRARAAFKQAFLSLAESKKEMGRQKGK